MSTSHNKIPMFSKEEYDDWKVWMQAHLAAQDDDMWFVITDGPMKIMKANTVMAITAGATQWIEKTCDTRTHENHEFGFMAQKLSLGPCCTWSSDYRYQP
ncbi:hypothetical protein F511_15495 [Dorcoceras hygrometricum]|uniref:Uncharacterized protein n=1 Tax=Dorcoceras hygrometricum TaxID=472368 RepID=A0A2Z7DGU5_9LAMI|nr:hypothetical protein F511_15495 [Dorcoceras hygrometricum]